VFSKLTHIRGHNYELFKGCSQVNTHKYFFSNRVVEIWNALPSTVVAASSTVVFKLGSADQMGSATGSQRVRDRIQKMFIKHHAKN